MTPVRRTPLHRILVVATALAVAGSSFLIGTGAGASAVYSPPGSIDATGTIDVSAALAEFLRGVPDGSTVRFPAGARYRIEGSLHLVDRHGLTIDGTGATFVVTTDGSTATEGRQYAAWNHNWPRKRGQFVIQGGSGIVLKNITIAGAHSTAGAHNDSYVPALEAQHGVEFYGAVDSVLEGCSISHVWGDPVSVSGASENITVRGCKLTHSGRQGITVDQARNVLLEGNHLDQIGRSTIDLEPVVSSWVVDGITIRNNTSGRSNGVFVAALGVGPVNNIRVEGNSITGDEFVVVVRDTSGARRKNWTLVDNSTDVTFGSPVAPLRFTRVDNVVVARNYQKISWAQSRQALTIDETTSVAVYDNRFPVTETTETGALSVNATLRSQPFRLGETSEANTTTTSTATTSTTTPSTTTTSTTTAPSSEGTTTDGGSTKPKPERPAHSKGKK